MNELQVFRNDQFGQVRTVQRDGQPWFVAADVCRALELGRTWNALQRIDGDEKDAISISTPGGQQEMSIVNEPGLYTLVLGSRKPEAKAFKRWITHEVIPSIRKSGGYIAGQETMTDAELLSKALLVAQRQIEARDAQIETMAPKALFADAVSASKNSILISELAKLLHQNGVQIGQKRLFAWMRDNGYLVKRKGAEYNKPTQKSRELGVLETKETAVTHADGHVTINCTPKVTGKGQQYFINKFLQNVQN